MQFFFAVHIKYLERGLSPSLQLAEFSQIISKSKQTEDATASALIDLAIHFIDLHRSVRNDPFFDPQKVVLKALLLDTELESWEAKLPLDWPFTVQAVDVSDTSHFNGQYHLYHDVWSSRMLNHYRWIRILLILDHMMKLPYLTYEHLTRKANAAKTITTMATDICICFSSYFQMTTLVEHQPLSPLKSGMLVFLMIWPLSIAGGGIGVPEHLYTWVLNQLDIIINHLGVLSAQTMLERTKMRREKWMLADIVTAPRKTGDATSLH